MSETKVKSKNLSAVIKIALLGVIAGLLTQLSFPIAFYKMEVSDVAVLLGGFALGPVAGVIIALIKQLVNLMINGTITAGVGELANFLMSSALVIPAALIYKKNKSKKTAFIGCVVGVVITSAVAAILNAYVLVPAFAAALGLPVETIIAMGSKIIPSIKDMTGLVFLLTIPFNIVKGILSTALTMLVYKKLSPVLHK